MTDACCISQRWMQLVYNTRKESDCFASIPPHHWTLRSFTVTICASATQFRSRSDFHPSQTDPWRTDPQTISEITEAAEKAPSLSLCAPVAPFVEEDHASVALQNLYEQVYNAIGGKHTDPAKQDTDQTKLYLQESSLTAEQRSIGVLKTADYISLDKFVRDFQSYSWLCKSQLYTPQSFSCHTESKYHKAIFFKSQLDKSLEIIQNIVEFSRKPNWVRGSSGAAHVILILPKSPVA